MSSFGSTKSLYHASSQSPLLLPFPWQHTSLALLSFTHSLSTLLNSLPNPCPHHYYHHHSSTTSSTFSHHYHQLYFNHTITITTWCHLLLFHHHQKELNRLITGYITLQVRPSLLFILCPCSLLYLPPSLPLYLYTHYFLFIPSSCSSLISFPCFSPDGKCCSQRIL